ncbi:MAG: hypothetical protein ACI4EN_02345 [Butyrivibrio sp.]
MRKVYFAVVICVFLLSICGCQYSNNIKETDNLSSELYDKVYFQTSDEENAERIEDMHRPEGYNENIASVLALKMSLNRDNAEYKYHTIVRFYGESMDETVRKVNEINNINLNVEEWIRYLDPYSLNSVYYYIFTAEEINALAGAGMRCGYVGLGEEKTSEIIKNCMKILFLQELMRQGYQRHGNTDQRDIIPV